ncbi:glycosyltransferase family 4 protein [Sphingomonas mollis]|uniref:Glycosyltransferase family 4 protein n=1 Tax=Sphingomonas mollis TaxID=2795726 RepID=A0ABS0XU87_9SPHN|nr:glycosyltransferase family 1 protein [Sphingomonas sp. BT553]MBJ6123330.1 glycosyltransferase family 4 protein [Sphingomonas sp. BT553]
MTIMPRILVDARLPWGSGIGRYVRNIVPSVAARMPSVSFTLLISPVDAERANILAADWSNVTVKATPIGSFSLGEQTKLPGLAREYDLTWFTNYWVPLRWSGRFVTTVHDLIHLEPSFPASAMKRIAAARTFGKVRRDAAHIIFDSRFSARVFEKAVGTPRKSSVVHLGIDHVGAPPVMASGHKRGKTALAVAAAKKHKNLPLLLDAWREANLKDWQLTLVTPSDDLRSSIDLTEQAERIANVHILRGISDTDLDALYASAGFVLVPSRYEGFGLPLLEAMRAGAPVISSTAPSLVEVASGALIPFVDPDDREGWIQAIRTMAIGCETAGDWQNAVSARNRVIAEGFTWDKAGAHTADILNSALAGGSQAYQ